MSGEAYTQCLNVRVNGHVQGVCFRYYTQQKANELGITGHVKNLPNGDVEALICGTKAQLDAMLAWLAHGPEHAQVSGCHARPITGPVPNESFRISY